jgi:hypothetical protein
MFNMTHFLIQGLRFPIRFTAEGEERIPGSAFLFDLKSPKDPKLQFDFKDNLFTLSVSLRLGNRGIVTLSDGGAIDLSVGDLLRRDSKRKLHPDPILRTGREGVLQGDPPEPHSEIHHGRIE